MSGTVANSSSAIGGSPGIPLGPGMASVLPPRLPQLAAALSALIGKHQPLEELIPAALDIIAQATNATWTGIYRGSAENPELAYLPANPNSIEIQTDMLMSLLAAAIQHQRPIARPLTEPAGRYAIVVPIRAAGQVGMNLVAIVPAGAAEIAVQAALVEYAASALAHAIVLHHIERLQWEAGTSAALVELLAGIQVCESIANACSVVVNELASFLHCEQVVVGLSPPSGVGVQVQAISGMSTLDSNAPAVSQFADALTEALIRGTTTQWPPVRDDDRHALLAHRKLSTDQKLDGIISIPLVDIDERPVGALLLCGRSETMGDPRIVRVIEALAPPLATVLQLRQRLEPTAWDRFRGWWSRASRYQKLWLRVAIAALVILPWVPMRYAVKSKCELLPAVRRFCVAPFAGIFKTAHVRVGDVVQKDHPLATMDDRELRWELSGLLAERARSAKLRDTAHADHETSEAQLAELEMERLDLRINLLRQRETQLQILSPLDGVVLKGELDDAEGAPVETGKALFEVAPLETLRLQLSVAEEDIPWVRDGMPVHARLEGTGGQIVSGNVSRIRPRAELINNEHVFVVEVDLSNPGGKFRPGMHGRGKIYTDRRSIGWILWHKAWYRIRLWTG